MTLRWLALALLTLCARVGVPAADRLDPSPNPPAGLTPAQVPQFIVLGFDDNQAVAPMTWFVDLLDPLRNPAGTGQAATRDGAPVRMTFFSNGRYWDDPGIVAIHRRAVAAGHELANHTLTHPFGISFSVAQWREEMSACDDVYLRAGVLAQPCAGFRAPYLQYGDATFAAMLAMGRQYDASIQEGYQADQDGTNFLWPYTLDAGSPGNAARYPESSPRRLRNTYPGLWEIPMHVFLIPADEAGARFGVAPGLRARMQANVDPTEDNPLSGRMTGLDWNHLESAKITGPEFLAILRHTLDLRRHGNRAPLMIGGHTSLYPADKPERRQAIADFLAYALAQPEVRFVTGKQLVAWLRDPVPLAPVATP
jgi:peptidoglycan/xylan/chitin deacetylase (PgdA/CDA1 family)